MTDKNIIAGAPTEEPARQQYFMEQVKKLVEAESAKKGRPLTCFINTFGCQMNARDSEKLLGILKEAGYEEGTDENSDFVLYNTCTVRENANLKVYGRLGYLSGVKRKNPDMMIALCGCMMQEPEVVAKIKKSYRHVDLIFGTHNIFKLAELLYERFMEKKMVVDVWEGTNEIVEELPIERKYPFKSGVNIMFGCNNFCTYCIVPYVRGRERSRRPEDIVAEARQLVAEGYKDITLLGQNVNSYGKDLDCNVDFADLIAMINEIPGEFLIRFMTSHPKDATEKLFKTMAECEKCAHQLHLPVQAGNDRVLEAMNRRYTAEKYLRQVELARSYMPDLVLTTDIIVGFPGETDEEFEDTVRLCEKVRYDAMFTFIYSKRVGTPAAKMPDAATREQKQVRFDKLLETANRISAEKHAEYIGKTMRVLVDGVTGKTEYNLSSRTNGGRLVHLKGDEALIGKFIDVRITSGNTWALYGEIE